MFGLNLRNEDGGGGTKVYIFGKVSLLGVQKFQNQSHMSYKKEKSFCGRSLKFCVTYQPQTEMLLLLHLWQELLQIGFEAISES